MPRTTDDVLVESVVSHHNRLRQAFLLGRMDQRREINNGVNSVIVSVVLAALACAGCVGYSFITHMLASGGQ